MIISTLKRCSVVALLVFSVGATNAPTQQLGGPKLLLGGNAAPATSWCAGLTLTGLQEVPLSKTNGLGSGKIMVAEAGGLITGDITTYRMHGTMAYIQEGAAGSNGPPIVTLQAGPHGTWLVPRGSFLTPNQYQSFLAGNLYVNVDSDEHRNGDIRGQLIPDSCRPLLLTPLAPGR